MKIIRKSRKIKSKYIGYCGSFLSCGLYIPDEPVRVFGDEIHLPDYNFLTRRSSYFLEKKTVFASIVSTVWHNLSLKSLLKA